MASEGGAEALADNQNEGAVDMEVKRARDYHDGTDSGP
jgi:hypothetical protein